MNKFISPKSPLPGQHPHAKHYKRLYLLVAVITIILGANVYYTYSSAAEGEWTCAQQDCAETRSGFEWAKDNCFDQDGQQVCKLSINGQQQIVAMASLDLNTIQQCVRTECVQEVKVRKVK
jgi:hypothetical protein